MLTKYPLCWTCLSQKYYNIRQKSHFDKINTQLLKGWFHTLGAVAVQDIQPKRTFSWYLVPWWRHRMETLSVLLTLYGENLLVTDGFLSQRVSSEKLWCFLWCTPEQTVEQKMESPVISDAMTVIWSPFNASITSISFSPTVLKFCRDYDNISAVLCVEFQTIGQMRNKRFYETWV